MRKKRKEMIVRSACEWNGIEIKVSFRDLFTGVFMKINPPENNG